MKVWYYVGVIALGLALSGTNAVAAQAKNVKETSGRGEVDSIRCDATEDKQLRVGEKHVFEVRLSPRNQKISVSDINFCFYEDEDYNNGSGVVYELTKEVEDANGILTKEMSVMRSQPYLVGHAPAKRSQENIITKYTIVMHLLGEKDEILHSGTVVQCARWAVTSCGDHVRDASYGEECDDGPNGSATCSPKCKKINK